MQSKDVRTLCADMYAAVRRHPSSWRKSFAPTAPRLVCSQHASRQAKQRKIIHAVRT